MSVKWTDHPILLKPTKERLIELGAEKGWELYEARENLIKAEKADPFNYGFDWHNSDGHFQHWKDFDEILNDPDVTTCYLFGGNRSLCENTPILNPETGELRPVCEIKGKHKVWAWTGSEMAIVEAGEPFIKGYEGFFRVTLSGGETFEVTSGHRVLTPDGKYQSIGSLGAQVGHLRLFQAPGHPLSKPDQHIVSIDEGSVGYVWDFHVPKYENYWACGAVHHNSAKTEVMAKRVAQKMENNPGFFTWVGGLNAESSKQIQQAAIHKYLPQHWRRQRPGVRQVNNIAFTQKNGFSNATFVGPNGSQCWFKNYSVDPTSLEGANLDLIWLDELVPYTWVTTLRYRLIDRKGKMVISFTPIEGYTPTVKEAMAGHIVTKWKECDPEVIPEGRMPYIGRTRNGDAIMWFHSQDNPYIPWGHFKKAALQGKTKTEKEIRAYGYVRNPIIGKFPRFGEHHIIKPEQVPKKGTNYMCVDPTGGDRNWFMVWLRVDDAGRCFVYREWPDLAHYGEWAVPSSKSDGSPGPAQKADCGRNMSQYRKLIKELEEKEREPAERYIDPRAGKAPVLAVNHGNTSMIDRLAEDVVGSDGEVIAPGMVFIPAPHTEIDEGVQAINDMLSYNIDEPVTALNEPKLYISEACGNLIYALREWTGEDKDKGACKDPADALRYLVTMEPCYVDPGRMVSSGGGHY